VRGVRRGIPLAGSRVRLIVTGQTFTLRTISWSEQMVRGRRYDITFPGGEAYDAGYVAWRGWFRRTRPEALPVVSPTRFTFARWSGDTHRYLIPADGEMIPVATTAKWVWYWNVPERDLTMLNDGQDGPVARFLVHPGEGRCRNCFFGGRLQRGMARTHWPMPSLGLVESDGRRSCANQSSTLESYRMASGGYACGRLLRSFLGRIPASK